MSYRKAIAFCGKGVIYITHIYSRRKHTPGYEWIAALTPTQGSYWWHHSWASGHSTLSMFRKPFSQLWLHHGSLTDMTAVAFILEITELSRLQARAKMLTLEEQLTISRFTTCAAAVKTSVNGRQSNQCVFNNSAILTVMEIVIFFSKQESHKNSICITNSTIMTLISQLCSF